MLREVETFGYLAYSHVCIVKLHFYFSRQLLVYQLLRSMPVKVLGHDVSQIPCGDTESVGIERHQMFPGTVLSDQT